MAVDIVLNPAEKAAQKALDQIFGYIDKKDNFLLEAGAGAGKTYSLIKALQHLIEKDGMGLLRRQQQVACITYTNVAKNEIVTRTDGHSAIYSETIHAFCWSLIKDFQPVLRAELPKLGNWPERIADQGELGELPIVYDLGYPAIEEKRVTLHHNDVLGLTVKLLENSKFRNLFASRYPILFIDEYQDTDKELADALQAHFLGTNEGPLIGFFGDPWQKIYGTGCGKIDHPSLKGIGKESNFRSVSAVVDVLNNMRPELKQYVTDTEAQGSAIVYHSNDWDGERLTGAHWKGDLPANIAHEYLEKLKQQLSSEGWDLSPEKTKILMLTHNILATEQGYSDLAQVFENNDAFTKKEDDHIAFFIDVLEPVCRAYLNKRYGEMFAVLGRDTPTIRSHTDKLSWASDMDALCELRSTGTIGAVLDHLKQTKRPRLPDSVERKEQKLEASEIELKVVEIFGDERLHKQIERLEALRKISYKEVIALANFLDDLSPFKTKHGVKGAEYENVMVVFGRGWNLYNFNQMLEWAGSEVPANKIDTFERSRNLFYVVCSRPKSHLALLFTQELSGEALATLAKWFGKSAIHSLEL